MSNSYTNTIVLDLNQTSLQECQHYIHLGFVRSIWLPCEERIRLEVDDSTQMNTYQALDQAEFILNAHQLLKQVSGKFKKFELDRADLELLYSRLYDYKEWSCCWKKIGKDKLGILHTSWLSAAEDYDSSKENVKSFNVNVSKATKYSCHTHPFIGYLVMGLLFSSPSILDFMSCMRLYQTYRFHFVATMEGLYQIEFSPETRILLLFLEQKYPEIFELFIYLFHLYLSNQRISYAREAFEELTEMDSDSVEQSIHYIQMLYEQGVFHSHDIDPIRMTAIGQYLNYVNQATLEDLIYFTPTRHHQLTSEQLDQLSQDQSTLFQCLSQFMHTDFKIFRLCYFRYVSWADIQQHPYFEAIDYSDLEYAPFAGFKSG